MLDKKPESWICFCLKPTSNHSWNRNYSNCAVL